MINVQGAKAGAAPSETERYSFREPGILSRLPIYIALAIVGIVAYVRSALPDLRWPSQPSEPEPAPGGEPTSAPLLARIEELEVDQTVTGEIGETAEPPSSDEEPMLRNRVGNVVPFPIPSYRLVDSPPIAFASLEVDPVFLPGLPEHDGAYGRSGSQGGAGTSPASDDDDVPTAPERRNRSPESGGVIRLNEAIAGAALLIGIDQLLAGASDPDGDSLRVGAIRVSEGSIARTADGFVYSSNAAALPKDIVVLYEVSDGYATTIKTAVIPLIRGPILGTSGDDILLGTTLGDVIEAGDGDDLIDARAGNDVVRGGAGNDHIVGGDGDDVIIAGDGNDVVFAGAGNDMVSGGDGDDRLEGEAGADVLSGDAGNDYIRGGEGNDLIDGGAGDDQLDDGGGADHVIGGEGDDVVYAALDAADDVYDGGNGEDTLDYSQATLALAIDLDAGTVSSEEVGSDRVSNFEAVIGGSGNDVFRIGGEAVKLTGGDGEDRFIFELPEGIDAPTLIHDILDFVAGDRINVTRFEFTMDEDDAREDRFERYYRDRDDPDEVDALELRIRYRDRDGDPTTIFEFDGDGDFEFEMTLEVHGHHQPFIYETVTA